MLNNNIIMEKFILEYGYILLKNAYDNKNFESFKLFNKYGAKDNELIFDLIKNNEKSYVESMLENERNIDEIRIIIPNKKKWIDSYAYLVEHDIYNIQTNTYTMSLLEFAYDDNNIEIFKMLIKHGATVDCQLLFRIISDNDYEYFKILSPHININFHDENNGQTPLMCASKFNNLNIVKDLLAIGVRFYQLDFSGCTSMTYLTDMRLFKFYLEKQLYPNSNDFHYLSEDKREYYNNFIAIKNELSNYVQIHNHTDLVENSKIFKLLYQISVCKTKKYHRDITRHVAKCLFY